MAWTAEFYGPVLKIMRCMRSDFFNFPYRGAFPSSFCRSGMLRAMCILGAYVGTLLDMGSIVVGSCSVRNEATRNLLVQVRQLHASDYKDPLV